MILEEIKKLKAHQDKVTYVADFLRMGQVENAAQYVAEAAQLLTATDTLVDRSMKQIHGQADTADNQANQFGLQPQQICLGTHGAKPIASLQPEKLQFDNNMAQFSCWKQHFRAYHNSSNLRVLTLTDQ